MKSFCKRYLVKVALVWAGGLVLLFLAYMFVLGPQISTREVVENQLAKRKQAYESALMATQDTAIRELNAQVGGLRERLSDLVIDLEDAANLTFDISQVASEKKLGLFRQRVEDTRRSTGQSELKCLQENMINVSFTGDFNQFATFLNEMERHRPVIFVDRFTMTRSAKSDSGHQAKMTLTVLVREERES